MSRFLEILQEKEEYEEKPLCNNIFTFFISF
jgi:hypothetical protein